jgi:hypothetical protein
VCQNWRSIVLASPSRLRLRLIFTFNTPTTALALESLSHLPICIDCSLAKWNCNINSSRLGRLISALRYDPDRVCRIAIEVWGLPKDFDQIYEALDLSFPALESLEFHNMYSMESVHLTTSLMDSIKSLRYLRLDGVPLTILFPILSVTRSLVDLILRIHDPINGTSLLTHLRHMPRLRNLQLFASSPSDEMTLTTTVLLPELTCFRFDGDRTQVEWFVAGSVTPSLREIHISFLDRTGTFCNPYLSQFIHVKGIVFFAARLTISLTCTTHCFAHPLSIDGPHPNIAARMPISAHPGSGPSAIFATIEDIFVPTISTWALIDKTNLEYLVQTFEKFPNMRVLRLSHGDVTVVANMLRHTVNLPPVQEANLDATTPSGTPMNSNKSQFTMDTFPSLEEIVLYARTPDTDGEQRASALELFGPFVTARHQVGRPVRVFWSTDGVPRYFMTGSDD